MDKPRLELKRNPAHEKMDAMSLRVAHAIEDENLLDVASVLAGMAVFALCEGYRSTEERQQALDTVVEFMGKQVKAHRNG
jgi:hypothetical protein